MAKKRKKKKSNAGARVADVLLSLLLVAGVGYVGYHVGANGVVIDHTTTYYNPETEEPSEPEPDANAIVYGNEEHANSEVHSGSLVLVSEKVNAPYEPSENGLESLLDLRDKRKEAEPEKASTFSGASGYDLLVTGDTANALLDMFDAFCAETGVDNQILVLGGYRTMEAQQALYDFDLGNEYDGDYRKAAAPGFSEHHTGLGVDFGLSGDAEYDGTGDYEWIDEHCAEFGLIRRYYETKKEKTGIVGEEWHYRYVGKPHASVIMGRGICLEEYIDDLRNYPYDGEHLQVTDLDGKTYEIYFYPEDIEHDTTYVPVPGGGLSYTVYGNNVDGFIVTVDTTGLTGEQATVGDDQTEEPSEEPEQPEDTP